MYLYTLLHVLKPVLVCVLFIACVYTLLHVLVSCVIFVYIYMCERIIVSVWVGGLACECVGVGVYICMCVCTCMCMRVYVGVWVCVFAWVLKEVKITHYRITLLCIISIHISTYITLYINICLSDAFLLHVLIQILYN